VILYGNLVPLNHKVLFGYRHGEGQTQGSILPTHTHLYVAETYATEGCDGELGRLWLGETKMDTIHFHELCSVSPTRNMVVVPERESLTPP
jgi:hypothetical protein